MSEHQVVIPKVILSETCYINTSPIFNGFEAMSIGNVERVCTQRAWPWQYSELATAFTRSQPLRYNVCGCMKKMVYECKVDTRDELFWQIFAVIKCVNNAAILCKATSTHMEQTGLSIQADAAHLEVNLTPQRGVLSGARHDIITT
jgi:hypothetical protein